MDPILQTTQSVASSENGKSCCWIVRMDQFESAPDGILRPNGMALLIRLPGRNTFGGLVQWVHPRLQRVEQHCNANITTTTTQRQESTNEPIHDKRTGIGAD